jgi:hypothetical protein
MANFYFFPAPRLFGSPRSSFWAGETIPGKYSTWPPFESVVKERGGRSLELQPGLTSLLIHGQIDCDREKETVLVHIESLRADLGLA